jgi:hypothetical protein
MNITISGCARCGENHKDIEIKEFTNPMGIHDITFYWWTMCPKLNEPILVLLTNDENK